MLFYTITNSVDMLVCLRKIGSEFNNSRVEILEKILKTQKLRRISRTISGSSVKFGNFWEHEIIIVFEEGRQGEMANTYFHCKLSSD